MSDAVASVEKITIALAGNANVGKSALFNCLAGASQHVANWPGKTVEVATGELLYRGRKVEIVDLPGTYALSANSAEEEITRRFIAEKKPDVVVNVVDVCALERNLFFSLELAQAGAPLVIALNQSDLEKARGLATDEKKLGRLVGARAVKTVATSGFGVKRLLDACLETAEKRNSAKKKKGSRSAAERYRRAARIAASVQKKTYAKPTLAERIDWLTTHRIYGYLIMLAVLGAVFYSIFSFGNALSLFIGGLAGSFRPAGAGAAANLVFEAVFGGFVAGVTLVLPYALPFYLLLTILEDTGYITRIAFLLDGLAHRIGFHGKAIIPLILGYGCNVPAIFGTRIMESRRDRLITAFAVTLVPCTARTVLVFGLVGTFLGPWWALGLYAFNAAVVALLSKLAYSLLPGAQLALIMEMPPYRMPSATVVLRHTWRKIKSIIAIVFPYYMLGGFAFALLYISGIFGPVDSLLSPVVQGWLGLPSFAATLLLFGLIRKELIVVLPAVLFANPDLSVAFTPVQMVVITVVALFYAPCLATIEALKREFGTGTAAAIAASEVLFAVLIGGLVGRALGFFI